MEQETSHPLRVTLLEVETSLQCHSAIARPIFTPLYVPSHTNSGLAYVTNNLQWYDHLWLPKLGYKSICWLPLGLSHHSLSWKPGVVPWGVPLAVPILRWPEVLAKSQYQHKPCEWATWDLDPPALVKSSDDGAAANVLTTVPWDGPSQKCLG